MQLLAVLLILTGSKLNPLKIPQSRYQLHIPEDLLIA